MADSVPTSGNTTSRRHASTFIITGGTEAAGGRQERSPGQLFALLMLVWAILFFLFPFSPTLSGGATLETLCGASDALMPPWSVYCVAVLVLAATISNVQIRTRILQSRPLLCASAAALLSVATATNTCGFASAGLWILFFLPVMLCQRDQLPVVALIGVLLAAQMITGLAFYVLGQNQFISPGFGRRAGGTFGTPNVLYPLSVVSLAFFRSAASSYRGWHRVLAVAAAGLSLIVLIVTYSRAGWLAGAVLLALPTPGDPLMLRRASLATAAALIALGPVVRAHGRVDAILQDRSAASRIAAWRAAWAPFQHHALLGCGYGCFARLNAVQSASVSSHEPLPDEPKSLYVNTAIETGLVGLAANGLFIASLLQVAWRVRSAALARRCYRLSAAFVCLAVPAILAAGIFDTPIFGSIVRAPATVVLLTFAGLLGAGSVQTSAGSSG